MSEHDEPVGFAVWDKPSNDWKVILFMVDGERNPALEWQLQYHGIFGAGRMIPVRSNYHQQLIEYGYQPIWVAVGVKEDYR